MPLRMVHIDRTAMGQGIRLRWGSIFSGGMSAIGFALFFLLLGNAIGLSILNTVSTDIGGGLRFWSWIYTIGTTIISYYFGSHLATRTNEVKGAASGAVHGMTIWALATVIAGLFAAFVSPTFRLILQGAGPVSGTWLAVFVLGLGFLAATLGGTAGKEVTRFVRPDEDLLEPEVKDQEAA